MKSILPYKRLPGMHVLFAILMFGCSAGKKTATPVNTATIKVMTYNIHHANPPSKTGVIDVDAIAEAVNKQQPDLLALQEIDVHTNRSGKQLNEAEYIANKTGMQFYFARAIDYDGGEYGVAILSRFPLADMHVYPLPTIAETKGEPRVLATAVASLPNGQQIRFACTHLDAQRSDTNRMLQIKEIIRLLKNETLPVVLAGDFNAVAGGPVIDQLDKAFTRTCRTDCGYTIPQINPNKTIDFIAFSTGRFNVLNHQVIQEQYASDHLPVVAQLKLD